jgi:hypothetical protein
MTASITLFVSLEMVFVHALRRLGALATAWHCALVTMVGMESVIYISAEIAGTMKPRAGANEDRPIKPLWAIVAGRSTVIGSDVIVAVGTFGSYADIDADLSVCARTRCRETNPGNCRQH